MSKGRPEMDKSPKRRVVYIGNANPPVTSAEVDIAEAQLFSPREAERLDDHQIRRN